jgi:hypothetical protein
MDNVRGDSRICIKDKIGRIKTVIAEEDFERNGYKAAGWTVVKEDWTKEREVKAAVDITTEMGLANLAAGAYKKQ